MHDTATLYGVSEQTLYRALAARARPKALRRADRGIPRALPKDQLERYCEMIAAIKVRTSNKKGRHLSTTGALRLIEEFGVDTPDGHVQAPKGILNKTTVNRYLQQWGYDRTSLSRQPAAVRFRMTAEDWRGLTPLIYHHVNPYGRIEFDMDTRLPLAA